MSNLPSLDAAADRPMLSVVIPAYNVAAYIEAAVESALDQTFRDLEVIVVDDGCTDESPVVLAALAKRRRDSRLRIVRQPNGGLANARNTGIRESRGTFIGFLDSDDLWQPNKAEKHLAVMQQDRSIGISFSHSAYLTEDGHPTGTILLAGKSAPTLHDMIRRNHVGNGSTPIVRRDCFEAVGLFRDELRSCEDYEMWCRIVWSRYRAVLVPEALTLYRLRTTSLSFNFTQFLANAERAIEHIQTAMPNLPPRVLNAGRAEHYRIAAWKAASSGQTAAARKILLHALRLRPMLCLSDWRAIGTGMALMLPLTARMRLATVVKSVQRRAAQHFAHLQNAGNIAPESKLRPGTRWRSSVNAD